MSDRTPLSEELLVSYIDGRLTPEEAASIAARIENEPEVRERVEAWRNGDELLRRALGPIAEEPIPPALSAALGERPRRSWFVPALAAAMAGAVVGLGVGFLAWGGSVSVNAREIAEIGLSAHQVYIQEVRHPIEVTVAEEDHLVRWLSNRVGTDIRPPDLSGDGLALLGGRVVPQDGQPAAMLMYEGADGERYTLLIARAANPEVTAPRYAQTGSSGAFYWMAGPVGYVLSGPNDRDRLQRLSADIYDQVI